MVSMTWSLQPTRCTHSSSVVTLARPSIRAALKITRRCLWYASPHLWNQLPGSFHQPCPHFSLHDLSLLRDPISSPSFSPLSPSITLSLFHSFLSESVARGQKTPELSFAAPINRHLAFWETGTLARPFGLWLPELCSHVLNPETVSATDLS